MSNRTSEAMGDNGSFNLAGPNEKGEITNRKWKMILSGRYPSSWWASLLRKPFNVCQVDIPLKRDQKPLKRH